MLRIALAALVGTVALGGTHASAEGVSQLPPHIRTQIRRVVGASAAVALVRVEATGTEAAPKSVRLVVERSLVGQLPAALEVATDGIAEEDLQPGAQLLMPFLKTRNGLVPDTLHYELVRDGLTREYEAPVFLSTVEREISKKQTASARAARKRYRLTPLKAHPSTVAAASQP